MSMVAPTVGIIANPASGRDVRRFVAHSTVFDNAEKSAIVRRALLGLEAVGITRVAYMPEDDFGIVACAVSALRDQNACLGMRVEPLPMPVTGSGADSTRAAQLLVEMGATCIITLGGDGTNRAVVKGCAAIPLVPISTGTNNVFPAFAEGTAAGMAAGLVAMQCIGAGALRRTPCLEVTVDGVPTERALVDVVVSSMPFLGSRAIWDMSQVREVVIARVVPGAIGFSALGGALLNTAAGEKAGAGIHIVLGAGDHDVLVALASGQVQWVNIAQYRWMELAEEVQLRPGAGTIALDGEREIELKARSTVAIRLSADGPFVVDVPTALQEAALAGFLHRRHSTRESSSLMNE
jgi:predicted polyphosphate/ATP-dependent NAD kinase